MVRSVLSSRCEGCGRRNPSTVILDVRHRTPEGSAEGVHAFRTLNLMSGILKRMPLDAGSAEGDDDG